MIIHDRASLSIYSDETTAAAITEVLGISPTSTSEKEGSEPRAHWSFAADESLADPTDETGFRTLQVLIDVLSTRAKELAALRETCETVIWWSGDSNTPQGGFVLPVGMLQGLVALGCDLYGTTYWDDVGE